MTDISFYDTVNVFMECPYSTAINEIRTAEKSGVECCAQEATE